MDIGMPPPDGALVTDAGLRGTSGVAELNPKVGVKVRDD